MQGRVEQADGDGQAVHGLEHGVEVAGLSLVEVLACLAANGLVVVQDVALDDLLAVAEEHVLGTAQADALSAEIASELGVGRVVGVSLNTKLTNLIGPGKDGLKVARDLGVDELDGTEDNGAGAAVDGDDVALVQHDVGAGDDDLLLGGVDLQLLNAADAGGAHAAGDDGGVARLAAVARKDALGGNHAGQVVGVGLPANEDAVATLGSGCDGIGRGEHDLAHSGARGGVETLGKQVVLGGLVELGVQELVELSGIDALERLFLRDEALVHHVDGDLEGGGGGALAHAGLQHEELALLDGELDVHHVAIVVLKDDEDVLELLAGLLKTGGVLERLDGLSVADAGHDVLALGVDQVVAVELLRAVGRVAREGNARGGGLALVAEDHAHDVDGGAQVVGNLVLLAVEDGAAVVPAAENSLDGKEELDAGVLGELDRAGGAHELGVVLSADVGGEDALELIDEGLEVLSGEVAVVAHARGDLARGDSVLEVVGVNAHHDVREHLDEATVRVPGKTGVLGLIDKALNREVVHAEVEDRVHHARHGERCTGTHGNEQRVLGVAKLLAGTLFKVEASLLDEVENTLGPDVAGVCILHAGLAGDGEARRDGQADLCHLGEVRTLTAEDIVVLGGTLGDVDTLGVLTELVDALYVGH